ncbi:MAG: L-iditol 2-dehydrogenase [Gaiellaceae bacterium]
MALVGKGRRGRVTAITLTAPRRPCPAQLPVPVTPPGYVIVHVEGCGVCGSSLPVWEGRPWFQYPLPPGAPGHEAWGRLDDGTRVTFLTQQGYAEQIAVAEETLVEIPEDGLPFPGEALACAVNVVRRARIGAGDRVAIVGMGFLGSAVAQLVPGATQVRRDTSPSGEFDRVIECAGTQSALDTASRLVATGGVLVIAGFHQDGPRTVDLQSWNWRGIDVVNAHERDERFVVDAMREAARGIFDVKRLVTHELPLARIGEAFELARTRPSGFVKAVVLT